MTTTVWVVMFHACNSAGEEIDVGPFSFSTEHKAKEFIKDVVADEMARRIGELDGWQQQEILKDDATLTEMVERYFRIVDEDGESTLAWSLDLDIVDAGEVREARKIFEFV